MPEYKISEEDFRILQAAKNPRCPCGLCNLNKDLIEIKERLHKIEEKVKI